MATWAMRQRYAWINERLAAGESFTRADIVNAFTVTKQTASATLREFEALHPDVVRYDATRKAFVRADTAAEPKGLNSRERGLLAAAREIDRLMLVIESAVRQDAPRDHPVVLAALKQNRAALEKATGQ